MLNQEDRETIITTIFEMIREEVTKPLTNLIDCLVFELISQNSVDTEQLEKRLSSLWETMNDEERDKLGSKLFHRYLKTFQSLNSEPDKWLAALSCADSNAEDSQALPDWFRGVIEGKAPNDPDS